MRDILFQYEQVSPSTWVYLSSLLLIALFFKFNRIWSVRNLDILLLILLAPGLLLVHVGRNMEREVLEAYRARLASLDPEQEVEQILQAESENGSTGEPPDDANANLADAAGVLKEWDIDELPADLAADFAYGRQIERAGFIWLFVVSALLLIRLLVDPTMVRRPLLEPNLTTGGMVFLIVFFYLFLMANVVISRPKPEDLRGPIEAARLMSGEATDRDGLERNGPGYAVLFMLPSLPTAPVDTQVERRVEKSSEHLELPWRIAKQALPESVRNREISTRPGTEEDTNDPFVTLDARYAGVTGDQVRLVTVRGTELSVPLASLATPSRNYVRFFQQCTTIAKTIAIVSHLAVLLALIAVGFWHFKNLKMGVGAALIYMIVPYTSQMTGRVDHVLPAALLSWAIVMYRRPLVAGLFIGLASGVIYYPLFLLPLWISFYWERGLGRFLVGCLTVVAVMVLVLFFVSADLADFWLNTKKMLGLMRPQSEGLQGIWGLGWPPVYRFSVLAAFVALCGSFALWPIQKNLGTLLSCTAAVMVATQFWHGYGGGLYLAWYLPTLLLTIFRPNLEDKIAVAVLRPGRGSVSAEQHLKPVA